MWALFICFWGLHRENGPTMGCFNAERKRGALKALPTNSSGHSVVQGALELELGDLQCRLAEVVELGHLREEVLHMTIACASGSALCDCGLVSSPFAPLETMVVFCSSRSASALSSCISLSTEGF